MLWEQGTSPFPPTALCKVPGWGQAALLGVGWGHWGGKGEFGDSRDLSALP